MNMLQCGRPGAVAPRFDKRRAAEDIRADAGRAEPATGSAA